MGKKKTKGMPPPEQRRFKDLLRRLVAVPKTEADEKMRDYRAHSTGKTRKTSQ